VQRALLERQAEVLMHEEQRRSQAESRLKALREEAQCTQRVELAEAAHSQRMTHHEVGGATKVERAMVRQAAALRAELGAESAAVRRAYHYAEEQQWRHEALLDDARSQALRSEFEVQELRSALRARDEVHESQLFEERRLADSREAAALARAEANLRAELGAEREALYIRIREQLVSLSARPSALSQQVYLPG